MSENQKVLVFSHICARPRHGDAPKRHFRHYMAQIGGNFLLKSAHGTKFPWDGSADPWDGNRNPWDGLPGRPHRRTKTTLKGGRRWASALTLCHIAHTARPPAPRRPGRARKRRPPVVAGACGAVCGGAVSVCRGGRAPRRSGGRSPCAPRPWPRSCASPRSPPWRT